jgi:hypothetical protein
MLTIGILNIVFGALGAIICGLVVLAGGVVAAGGAGLESELGAEADGAGAMVAAGGGIIMVIGLVGLACWTLLFASGIGVLKLAPWGRTLSIICGVAGVLLNGSSLVMNGFQLNLVTLASLVYCGLLVGLFMKPDWKAAFSGMPTHTFANNTTSQTSQFRRAA